MKCLIDFDDTLVHRTRMSDDIYAAFGELSSEELRTRYAEYRKLHPFTINGFCDYIKQLGFDGDRLRELFFSFAKRANAYVFPDAIAFIERLKAAGHECILLSFDAEPELWQHPKIESSGLAPLFHQVHVIQYAKPDLVRSWTLSEPFVFLDDKPTEIEAMRRAFPESLCIEHMIGAPLLPHLTEIEAFANKQH